MTLKQRIDEDIKSAILLRKKKLELDALRAIQARILKAETRKGKAGKLTVQEEVELLQHATQEHTKSSEIFEQQGKVELFQKEMVYLEVISQYLPKPISPEEIVSEIKRIADMLRKGIESIGDSDDGDIMEKPNRPLKGKTKGKAPSDGMRRRLLSS